MSTARPGRPISPPDRRPDVDAIDICLPGPQHREVAEAAIAAGKHVTLEKPITLTLEDADALVALSKKTDRVFMIAHVLRFWPEYMEIHKRVTSGDYGNVISGLAYRRQPFPAWSKLFAQSDPTGGAVIDQMIHDYDALNWVIGAPKSVVAHGVTNPRSAGGIDQVQVMLNYGEASALVDGGMMMPESYPFTSSFQILCERGSFEYNFRAGGRSVEMGGGTNELTFFPNSGDPEVLDARTGRPLHRRGALFHRMHRQQDDRLFAPPRPTPVSLSKPRSPPKKRSNPAPSNGYERTSPHPSSSPNAGEGSLGRADERQVRVTRVRCPARRGRMACALYETNHVTLTPTRCPRKGRMPCAP